MTVLQKIIEHFKSQSHADDDYYRPMAVADVLKRYLEAEEQQIRDAYTAGFDRATKFGPNVNDYINNLNS